MTKTEQIRLKTWRLKVLRYAAERPRNVARTCRHFGISRRAFYKWKQRYDADGEAGLYDRPRTPHLNGKVERSHRVDDQEFSQRLDQNGITDDIHLFNTKLREWEDYYNYHRPHGALDGHTPYERLLAKTKN